MGSRSPGVDRFMAADIYEIQSTAEAFNLTGAFTKYTIMVKDHCAKLCFKKNKKTC